MHSQVISEIRELHHSEFESAALLLSRGMRDNPNNVAAFGRKPERRERIMRAFFRGVLRGESSRGVLLGVCGMARPGQCQPAAVEKVRILGALTAAGALRTALRVGRWAGEWARHDPHAEHWHLGPVAVDSHLRGRGVGGAMLSAFCARMDEAGAVAYLETDKRANVNFYERYAFRVDNESSVLGKLNWYMTRSPK